MTFPQALIQNIPPVLREGVRHNIWRYETRGGKLTKPPYTPHGRRASHSDPRTWATFGRCLEAANRGRGDGLGVMLGSGLGGIDLDDCVDERGRVSDFAAEIVARVGTYTEYSPSGTGLHLYFQAPEMPGLKLPEIEVYTTNRSLTLTGKHLPDTPRNIAPFAADALIDELRPAPATVRSPAGTVGMAAPTSAPSIPLEDTDLLLRAFGSKNGHAIERLWHGDTEGYRSASEADAALVARLAFWTGPNVERLAGLVRGSGLWREKWDVVSGTDGLSYIERTAAFAIDRTSNFYRGRVPESWK